MKLPEKLPQRPDGLIDTSHDAINQIIDYLEEKEKSYVEISSTGETYFYPKTDVETGSRGQGISPSPHCGYGCTQPKHTPTFKAKTITLPKPEWWDWKGFVSEKYGYKQALSDASKASGITFLLED